MAWRNEIPYDAKWYETDPNDRGVEDSFLWRNIDLRVWSVCSSVWTQLSSLISYIQDRYETIRRADHTYTLVWLLVDSRIGSFVARTLIHPFIHSSIYSLT